MITNWKEKTCDSCEFCIKDRCLFNPPTIVTNINVSWYPKVNGCTACSKYAEKK